MKIEDAAACVAIDRKCFGKRDAWRRNAFIAAAQSWRDIFFVAEADGKIVACTGAEVTDNAAEIQTIAVDPDYHGLGIGTKIFAELLTAVRERDVTSVYLEVRPNNTPAIELYERFGFRTIGQLENYYRDGDALIMFLNF